jgi:cell division septum initiation protein DivIVA
MTDRILSDAQNLKKLIREAEALADESMIAFARLKQAMLTARQNPSVEVHMGQRALMRLNQAEGQAMAMSTSLLRVHDELSNIARETMGEDYEHPTELPPQALEAVPSTATSDPVEA